MGLLQVLRLEFQKFRILEILNFHPFTIDTSLSSVFHLERYCKHIEHKTEVCVIPTRCSDVVYVHSPIKSCQNKYLSFCFSVNSLLPGLFCMFYLTPDYIFVLKGEWPLSGVRCQ